jgi:ABC-type multidrug transport system permease subunit
MAGEEKRARVLLLLTIVDCRFQNAERLSQILDLRVLIVDCGMKTNVSAGEFWFYLLAAACGIGTGWADVAVDDLLFTALLVLMACILLGLLRPRWPWRWVLLVGTFIPLTELAAYVILTVKPTRAQVFGSFLAFLPGIAGAYGGSLMRRVMDNLRQGK